MKPHKQGVISVSAVRNANERLMSKRGVQAHIVSQNSRDGNIQFKGTYSGRTYDIKFSKAQIESAYAKALKGIKSK